MLKSFLKPLASLKLTVGLLALAMALVYAGTWAQVDHGIWEVQKQYFHSFLVYVSFGSLFPRHYKIPGAVVLPGGYTLGVLLLINLLAAHTVRFKFRLNRFGIILIHLGLILLLVGEGLTSAMASESLMRIENGATTNFSYDERDVELAVTDTRQSDYDQVYAISSSRFRGGGVIHDHRLPFDIEVGSFFPNSEILGPAQAGERKIALATAGSGTQLTVVPVDPIGGTNTEGAIDFPSAYVTPIMNGRPLGTYLLTTFNPGGDLRQGFLGAQQIEGTPYRIELRFKRIYQPYSVHLLQFTHDLYPGTQTPRNFASTIRLLDPDNHVVRPAKIWMNHPLRYNGQTFYQSGFTRDDRSTILQVVSNPAYSLPYLACLLTGLGLLIHFRIKLVEFLERVATGRKRVEERARSRGGDSYELGPKSGGGGILVWVAALAGIGYIAGAMISPSQGKFNIADFGKIPICFQGRIQPLESVACNSLRGLSNYETFKSDSGDKPAIEWLLDVLANPAKADQYKVFRIDNPEIKTMLGAEEKEKYFSYEQFLAHAQALSQAVQQAENVDRGKRDVVQEKLLELKDKSEIYAMLLMRENLQMIPPAGPGRDWEMLGTAEQAAQNKQNVSPVLFELLGKDGMLNGWATGDAAAFNRAVAAYRAEIQTTLPSVATHVDFEYFYDCVEPFYRCMVLYVFVFLLIALSWLFWRKRLGKAAFALLLVTFVFHTVGLIARIYISGRPPVTNLAASALFIGWGVCALCIGLEFIFRNGLAVAMAAIIGAVTLLIAHMLSLDGDNMAVLQAVLDTNFWLATHVVCVTLGYATTFLAGCLGIVYVVLGLFTSVLRENLEAEDDFNHKILARMIYGIVCFAMFFSFVGTVLGGIWADQSWGRFWGWDPKENGAVLVVLCNALLLHARWGGLAKERGVALIAIFGNVVTAWSWFGTNMLGVGLHSYGFMDKALLWLLAFVGSQVLLIAIGLIPRQHWGSFTADK